MTLIRKKETIRSFYTQLGESCMSMFMQQKRAFLRTPFNSPDINTRSITSFFLDAFRGRYCELKSLREGTAMPMHKTADRTKI